MNKRSIYLSAGVIICAAVIFSLVATVFVLPDPTKACGGNSIGGGADKCFGTIALRQDWDASYYAFFDYANGYQIAGIDSAEEYIDANDKIYVINKYPNPGFTTSQDGKKTYYLRLFQDQQLNRVEYLMLTDVPTYLVIDYTTNEVRAYSSIGEVPQEEQNYFRTLERI